MIVNERNVNLVQFDKFYANNSSNNNGKTWSIEMTEWNLSCEWTMLDDTVSQLKILRNLEICWCVCKVQSHFIALEIFCYWSSSLVSYVHTYLFTAQLKKKRQKRTSYGNVRTNTFYSFACSFFYFSLSVYLVSLLCWVLSLRWMLCIAHFFDSLCVVRCVVSRHVCVNNYHTIRPNTDKPLIRFVRARLHWLNNHKHTQMTDRNGKISHATTANQLCE